MICNSDIIHSWSYWWYLFIDPCRLSYNLFLLLPSYSVSLYLLCSEEILRQVMLTKILLLQRYSWWTFWAPSFHPWAMYLCLSGDWKSQQALLTSAQWRRVFVQITFSIQTMTVENGDNIHCTSKEATWYDKKKQDICKLNLLFKYLGQHNLT